MHWQNLICRKIFAENNNNNHKSRIWNLQQDSAPAHNAKMA
jgi:hypothetical protein